MANHLGLRGERLALARVLLVVVPSFFLFGYNQSAIGGLLNFTPFVEQFPRINTATTKGAQKADNSRIQGTVVALYAIGCLIGALTSALVGNRLGRRPTILVFAVIAAIGATLQGSSFSLAQLIVGRITSGIGVGGVNAVIPVWQSECSKPKNRGQSVVVIGIFISSGIALASWVNFGLSYSQETSMCWRLSLLIPIIFSCLICSSTYLFPESPRWLAQQGRVEEARAVIAVLEDQSTESEHVAIELDIVRRACDTQGQRERGFVDLFKMGRERLLYRFSLSVMINFCAQMTGANVISYYASTIFSQSLGFEKHQSSVLAAGLLTWKIVAASLAYYYIDRAGRRPLFMISGLGMGISMMCLAIIVSQLQHSGAGAGATFFLFMFMFFFPLGYLGANFLYSAEIAPQDLRIHLSAVGTSAHWLFNFVIAEVTPVAFATIGYKYYTVYACTGVSVLPMVYFLFPETNGRSLDDMDRIFSGPEHWWQVPSATKHLQKGTIVDIENGDEKLEKFDHVEEA
ncbi:general substrate transporter [Acephala macrosclerotiorum]|nr:general substrate transporter [Acephala macrosclerotiorum]